MSLCLHFYTHHVSFILDIVAQKHTDDIQHQHHNAGDDDGGHALFLQMLQQGDGMLDEQLGIFLLDDKNHTVKSGANGIKN